MGADQSTGGTVQLKSQRDEDIPYTSYSLSKPIDGGRWFNVMKMWLVVKYLKAKEINK